MPGDVKTIAWTVDPNVNGIMIHYSANGGSSWTGVNKCALQNTGRHSWTVPDIEAENAKIKIEYLFAGRHSEPARIATSARLTITRGWFGES